jgi:hypothetical protein
MTLEEFLRSERASLRSFELYWLKGVNYKGPPRFPENLDVIEWTERYIAWLEQADKAEKDVA